MQPQGQPEFLCNVLSKKKKTFDLDCMPESRKLVKFDIAPLYHTATFSQDWGNGLLQQRK